jgi:hypothetical protein
MKAPVLLSRSIFMSIAAGVLIAVCVACVTPPSATAPVAPTVVTLAPNTPTATPSAIASPTISTVLRTMPFEVIAEGAPFVGKGRAPILLAIRGDDPKRVVPDELPQTAKEALQKVLAQPTPDLYIVVYTGIRSSSGYQIRVNSITVRRETERDWLVVNYSEVKPSVGQGGATVLTHPFVIVRVRNTHIRASDVMFESQ